MSSIDNKNFTHHLSEKERQKILEIIDHAERALESKPPKVLLDLGSVPLHQTVEAYPVGEAA